MLKKLSKCFVAPLFAVAIIVLSHAGQADAATNATLFFDKTAVTVNAGQTVTLVARLNPNANNVGGVELDVQFAANVLRLDSIVRSNVFNMTLAGPTINNTNGTGAIDVGLLTSPASYVNLTADVATFTFTALANAVNSPVTFAATSDASANGSYVVSTRTGAQVTVGSTVPTDTVAPIITGGSPTGALNSGTTQVTMSVVTNENATCKYSSTSGVAYSAMANTFTQTGAKSHTVTITGLTNGSSYTRYIRCIDASGNFNTADYTVSFSVSAATPTDTIAPIITSGSPTGALNSGTTQVTMSVATNENATCKFSSTPGVAYSSMSNTFAQTGSMSHTATITGLTNGSSYTRYVRCIDTKSNANTSDYSISFSVSSAAPVNPSANATLSFDKTAVTVNAGQTVTLVARLNPNANNVGGVELDVQFAANVLRLDSIVRSNVFNMTLAGPTINNTNGTGAIDVGLLTSPASYVNLTADVATFTFTALANAVNSPVTFAATSNASANGAYIVSTRTGAQVTVGTGAVTDTTAPVITGGSPTGALSFGTTQTTMTVTTDENATCHYSATANTAYTASTLFMTTGAKIHSVAINNLTNGSSYNRYIRCMDTSGNSNTVDYIVSFSVPAVASNDVAPPVRSAGAPANVLLAGTSQVTVSLVTNENATCRYSTTANTTYPNMTKSFTTTGTTNHSISLNLVNGGTYTQYVRCVDTAGNVNSDDYLIYFSVATTGATPPVVVTPPGGSTVGTSDADGDGLSYDMEIAVGTDPNKADTDGDGYSDKQEITSGYNPNSPGTNTNYNSAFTNSQKGKIFIQVESKGRAWYVNPADGKRYFLNRPADAYTIIRNFAVGVNHSFILANQGKSYSYKHRGKIFLDVGDRGKAYYIDSLNGKAYFLGSPEKAYEIIRQRGVGITNANLSKIMIGYIQ